MSEDPAILRPSKRVRAILAVTVCIVAASTGWVLYEYAIKSSTSGPLVWPTVELTLSDSRNETLTVTAVEWECQWVEVQIILSNAESEEHVSWDIPRDGLLSSTGIAVTLCLESQGQLEGTTVICNITDTSGNDNIDVGDHLTLSLTDSDYDDPPVLELRLIYKPMGELMGSIQFQPGEGELRDSSLPASLAAVAALAVAVTVVIIHLRRRKSRRLN